MNLKGTVEINLLKLFSMEILELIFKLEFLMTKNYL